MADNTELDAGSGGDTIATDDIAGVKHQRVKIQYGADGSATDVSDANPLPIDDAGGSLTVDNAQLSVVGGGTEAAAMRVTVANDSTGLISVDDGGGSLTIDGTVIANLSATDNAVLDQIEVNTSYGDNTGGGVEAGSLRVTIANDSTGVVTVDDGGGSLTVDGTITEANSGTIAGDTTSIDGKITACNTGAVVLDTGAATIGEVTIGAATTAAADLAKVVDAVAGGSDVGVTTLAVRDDSLTTLTPADGDYTPLRVNSTGALHVTGAGGGTEYTEDVATPNPIIGTATLMERDDVLAGLTPAEGDWAGLRCSAEGALWMQDFNSDAVLADTTTIAGDTTSIDGKITACNTGAVVISSGTVTTVTSVTNDVNIADGGNSITVDNGGTFATQAESKGDVAHDAADSGNPVKTGSKAVLFNSSAPPNAAAAENDRVNNIADEYGRQYVEITHPNYWDVSVDYAGAQTNATIKAAAGAGLSLYITDLIISNGAVAGNITLLDGSGGTVLLELYPAITGGLTHSFRSPIKLTANTLLAITSTTVTTHSVTVAGFIAP